MSDSTAIWVEFALSARLTLGVGSGFVVAFDGSSARLLAGELPEPALCRVVCDTGEPYVAEDLGAGAELRPGAAPIRQFICTPMRSASGEVYAALGGWSTTAGTTTNEQINQLACLARIAEHAMQERLEQRVNAVAAREYRGLRALSPEPYIVLDIQGRILRLNDAAAALTGGSARAMIGRSWKDLAPSGLKAHLPEEIRRFPEERVGLIRRTYATSDGTRTIDWRVVPIPGQGLIHALGRDVTDELANAEELRLALVEAERANAVKSNFLATMSHELRTPLTAVIGFSNLLAAELEDPDHLLYAERIHSNGRHLLNVINDVLDLSRIEAGHLRIHVEPIDIGLLLDDVVGTLYQSAEVPLAVVGADHEVLLHTDPQRFRQVVLNLTKNAVKFTKRGSITLEVHAEHGVFRRLDVRDTGPGIPEQQQNLIFEAFEQVEGGLSRSHEGTGLGLPISKRLCHFLGLELTLHSAPGEGSTFSIRVPERSDHRVVNRAVALDPIRAEQLRAVLTEVGLETDASGRESKSPLRLVTDAQDRRSVRQAVAAMESSASPVCCLGLVPSGTDLRGSALVARLPDGCEGLHDLVDWCVAVSEPNASVHIADDEWGDLAGLANLLPLAGLRVSVTQTLDDALASMADASPEVLVCSSRLLTADDTDALPEIRKARKASTTSLVLCAPLDTASERHACMARAMDWVRLGGGC